MSVPTFPNRRHMFLFYRLLLAHFIADFPLQFTKLFRLKTEGIKGTILHGSVFGITAVLLSTHFLVFKWMGIFLIFLWIFHIFTDWLKIKLINHYKNDSLALFLLDQMLHIAAIGVVILFNFPSIELAKSRTSVGIAIGSSFISRLYSNDLFIIFCIFYILATFTATVLIYYLKKTYAHSNVSFPVKGKYYDIMERALITTLVMLPGYFYFLVGLVIGIKWSICREKNFGEGDYDFSRFNLIASSSIAILVGVILRWIIS